MNTLLHVMASPRGEHSISRALGSIFVDRWRESNVGGLVVERDLNAPAIPYMDQDWIAGVYAPPLVERTPQMLPALTLSAELIGELERADCLLISTPMYNFTIPAILKSWIDYIVRPSYTFELAPGWPGMLSDRPVRVVVATRDSEDIGSEDDHVTPVIRRAMRFIGLADTSFLLAGGSLGVNRGEVPLHDHLARFQEALTDLVPAVSSDGG